MDTQKWTERLYNLPGTHLGNFRVSSLLGQGGTAAVFLGERLRGASAVPVAIKVLNPHILDLDSEKPRLERQLTLQGHDCSYLIKPIEWFQATIECTEGSSHSTLVDVSEYVSGFVLDPPNLSESRIHKTVGMVARAAAKLDKNGFCHRDIKPENIVLRTGGMTAVLLDLGVLHAYRQDVDEVPRTGSLTNHALVTRRYSSPELLAGRLGPQSPKKDWLAHTIYQLGTLLFEAITQRRIFGLLNGDELVTAISMQDPFRGCPVVRCPELEELARTCLAKEPAERFAASWDQLECRRQVRRPTVVFLYCGGTIGAATSPTGATLRPRILTAESVLPKKVTRRLICDYRDLAPSTPLPEFEWRFLERSHQIFSENATAATWNAIASAVADILAEEWSDRYLLGIVLLHGTDTLAYSATALQLAFRELPCPVVLTGSNQPPSDEHDVELSWLTSQSDAWSNLLKSVLFLVDGGHRMPMVYVVFANTVCHAVNVQKVPLNRTPLRFASSFAFFSEAFSYRNFELGRRFAYKYVEGVLINSFLPVLQQTAFEGPFPDGKAPWERATVDVAPVHPTGKFSDMPDTIAVFPCIKQIASDQELTQLVVAFPSGTISDARRERLSNSSVVVTQWGLSPHLAEYNSSAENGPRRELKLFRVLPETALPLISLALSQDYANLEQGIAQTVLQNPIFRALLGNPLDREHQRARAEYLHNDAKDQHAQTIEQILHSSWADSPAVLDQGSHEGRLWPRVITFRKHHFEARDYGLAAPYVYSGSLPEHLGVQCDVGFSTGISIAHEWEISKAKDKDEFLLAEALRLLQIAVIASGLAKVRFKLEEGSALVSIKIESRQDPQRHSVYKESWGLDIAASHQFLKTLEEGVPPHLPGKAERSFLQEQLRILAKDQQRLKTNAVYWYILGLFKGAVCRFLANGVSDPIRRASKLRRVVMLRLLPGGGGDSKRWADLVFERRHLKNPDAELTSSVARPAT